MTSLRHRVSILVALGSALVSCKPPPPEAPPPPLVTVAHPIQREIMEWDEYSGRTEAADSVELRARVGGVLESVSFTDGALVKQGDLLFKVDDRVYQATLAHAQAEVERSKASYDIASRDYERVAHVDVGGAVSAEEIDQRLSKRETAAATLHSAEAALAAAKLDVEFTEIRAPMSGRIGRKLVSAGNIINAGPLNGTILTTIVSIDPLYCYIDADERAVLKYIRLAREGKRPSERDVHIQAFLALADEKEFKHEGEVDFVDNRIDPTTGTLRGRIVFRNPDGTLIPGLYARVRLPGSGKYQALLVDDAAVGTDLGQRFVLTVDAQNVVQYKPVKLGTLQDGLRVVREGLATDDAVVVNGLMRARPGGKVQTQTAPMEPDQRTQPAGVVAGSK